MKISSKLFVRNALMGAASSISLSGAALAQDNADGEEAEDSNVIIVTATKREQSIQDVPVAVTAVSGETLARRGFDQAEDLNAIAPSLSIKPLGNSTETPIGIRGIESSAVNPGFEPAVGVVIDGVGRSRAGQALGDFLDVSRVEILRGPQGTLFGKNTSAGVLQLISNKPEFEYSGNAALTFGSYNLVRLNGVVTGPISDTIAFRLAGVNTDRDGILDLIGPGPSGDVAQENFLNDRNRYSLKGQILFEPSEAFSLLLIADYNEVNELGVHYVPTFTGPGNAAIIGAVGAYLPDNNNVRRAVQLNTVSTEQIEDWGVSGEVNWDLGPGTLTSITSYREYDADRIADLDGGGFDLLAPETVSAGFDTFTQELRFGGASGNVDWLVGAYYSNDKLSNVGFVGLGPDANIAFGIPTAALPLAGFGISTTASQDTDAYAVFTHNSWNITDTVTLTGGLRYSYTKKSGVGLRNGAAVGTSANDPRCAVLGAALTLFCDNLSFAVDDFSEGALTGTANVSYRPNSDINLYASYSRGYKSGGINFDREAVSNSSGVLADNSTFTGEFVNAYELGLKSTILGGRSRVNIAAFYLDYQDFQVSSFTGAGFLVLNADKIVSKGIEFESSTEIVDGINFDFNATYLDARFGDNLNPNDINPNTGLPTLAFQSGRRLQNAPKFRFNGAVNIEQEIGSDLRILGNFNFDWRDKQITVSTLNPDAEVKAYGLMNASIGIRPVDDNWGINFSVTNLSNVQQPQFNFDAILQAGSFSGFLTDQRMFSVTLDAKF